MKTETKLSPEERAKELQLVFFKHNLNECYPKIAGANKAAKQCAIAFCEEVLKLDFKEVDSFKEYWQQVKIHLEKKPE